MSAFRCDERPLPAGDPPVRRSAYRSAYDHIVGLKLDEVRESREKLVPLIPRMRDVLQARVSRIIGGVAGLAGAAAMVYYAIAPVDHHDSSPTVALVAGTVALGFTWLLARAVLVIAGCFSRIRPEAKLTGELDRDLALLDESDLREEVKALEARAESLETASVALPLAGITFLMPLFLHWIVGSVIGEESARNYAEWIRISLVIVGHAHIALAICGYLFARKLHRSNLEVITNLKIHREWAKIWLITIGISCLPGIVLFLVPPLLVAVTGIAFIPFMITLMRRAVLNERLAFYPALPERVRIAGLEIPAALAREPSAKEEQSEERRDDHDADANAGDRAQA
jgi:hypothetical protein